MTNTTKRVVAGAALGVGAIALVAVLLAWLDLAGYQQAQPGADHQRSAMPIRWIVLGEILVVLLACALVVWRSKSAVVRLVIAAVVVWALSLFDFYFIALAGAVPVDTRLWGTYAPSIDCPGEKQAQLLPRSALRLGRRAVRVCGLYLD